MSSNKVQIKMVVFDWAGTTIDFGCNGPSGAFVQVFQQKGVTISLKEARRPMGLHKKDHIRVLLEDPDIGQRWQQVFKRPWTEADVEELYRLVTPMQVEAANLYGELVPEVKDCVAKLRSSGIRIAATTGYFRQAAEMCYTRAKQQGYTPDFTICADEVSAGRPAPWMIYRCMEALNIFPPTSVVKVGDTLVDIADGINAGVWSIGVVDSSNEMGLSPREFADLSEEEREARREPIRQAFFDEGADGVIDTLDALPEVIEELNALLAEEE